MMVTAIEKLHMRQNLPDIRPGDTVRVTQKVKEGDKNRMVKFEGLVLARKHGQGISGTFTVRKVIDGIGVERIYPIHSPTIEKIEILRRSKVRRAKLYYIRDKAAREVRRKMKMLRFETPAADIAETPSEDKKEVS